MAQNIPSTFETFLLLGDEKKITIQKDLRARNAVTFIIMKEDHTLGQLLKAELMKDPDVIFSGYRMPHPLEHKLELRVQTAENCKPEAALMKAIENLIKESTFMEEKFRQQVEINKRSKDDISGGYIM